MRHARRFHIVAAAISTALLSTAHAAPLRWTTGAGGFFETPSLWNFGAGPVPGTFDVAAFGVTLSGTGPAYTVELNSSPTNAGLLVLRDNVRLLLNNNIYTISGTAIPLLVGQSSGESGALTLAKGTLITNAPVGQSSTLGQAAGATGLFTFESGGTWIDNAEERIGDSGAGTVNHPLASHTVNNSLFLAFNPGSTGTYNLSGPSASTSVSGNTFVGGNASASGGTGLLSISAGTFSVGGTLSLWNTTGSLSLTGGTLSASFIDTHNSPSRINWTAGTLSITGPFGLLVGANGPLGATPVLTASKVLNATNTLLGYSASPGTLTIAGGTLTGGTLRSGFFANSAVVHTSGLVSVTDSLTLAEGAGVTSSYTFSGGTISAPGTSTWAFGGTAIYSQTGGAASFGDVRVSNATNGFTSLTLNDPSDLATLAFNSFYMGNDFFLQGAGAGAIAIQRGSMSVATTLALANNNCTLSLSGGSLTLNTLDTGGNPARFLWSGGTLHYTNPAGLLISPAGPLGNSLNLAAAQRLTSTNTLNNAGILTLTGGSLGGAGAVVNNALLSGFGAIAGTAGFTNNASLSPTGILVLSNTGPNTNTGTIAFTPAAQLQLSSVALSNTGFIDLNSATISGGTLTNTVAGTLLGPGTIASAFSNAGLLALSSGLLKTPSFTNAGVILLDGISADIAAGATITNTGSVQGRGKISAALLNNATIEPANGTLIVAGALSNPGTLRAPAAAKLLVIGAFPTNPGIISLAGGTVDTNNQPLNNTGQITGFGILATGGLTNNAAITFTGGTSTINGPVTNAAGKTIVAKDAPALFTGPVTNLGTFKITNTTVTFAGPYAGNAYISDPSTNIFQSDVTILPGGLMSGGNGDQFLFNGPSFTNHGTFNNDGTLQSSSPAINDGAFAQNGPQSWATTTFTNNAGTATFASNTGSPTSAPLSILLNNGAITFASPQNLNALTLNNGQLTLLTGSTKTNALTLATASNIPAARLEITSNALIVQATANKPTTLSTLQNQLTYGTTHPAGITSTTTAADPTHKLTVAIDNALLNLTTFYGQQVDTNSLLLLSTYYGDSNLDRKVNVTDLGTLATYYGQPTAAFGPLHGDFNNDGLVNVTDLGLLATNYGQGTTPGTPFPLEPSQLLITNYQLLSIPEPTSLALLLPTLLLLHKRKHPH